MIQFLDSDYIRPELSVMYFIPSFTPSTYLPNSIFSLIENKSSTSPTSQVDPLLRVNFN
jgi:hypothetical protein